MNRNDLILLARRAARWRGPLRLRRYTAAGHISTIELRQTGPFLGWLGLLAWYLAAPTAVAAVGLTALTTHYQPWRAVFSYGPGTVIPAPNP